MRRFRFVQYDVFADVPFGGNQLAVFPDAAGLSDGEMQAIAREMNYSETTFVLPATDPRALNRVRIFTPTAELPFAGHPVIGTTFALAGEGVIRADDSPVYLELGIGTLAVDALYEEQRLSFAWMHQPVPKFSAWLGDRNQLAAALRFEPSAYAPDLPIERGSAGIPFIYVPLRAAADVARAYPGGDLLTVLADEPPTTGIFVFAVATAGKAAQVHGRMFAPGMGIVEDAASGSAAGPLGAYLLNHHVITLDDAHEARVLVTQGVEMGRPSRLHVALTCTDRTLTDVRVGGEAVRIAEGELVLPARE